MRSSYGEAQVKKQPVAISASSAGGAPREAPGTPPLPPHRAAQAVLDLAMPSLPLEMPRTAPLARSACRPAARRPAALAASRLPLAAAAPVRARPWRSPPGRPRLGPSPAATSGSGPARAASARPARSASKLPPLAPQGRQAGSIFVPASRRAETPARSCSRPVWRLADPAVRSASW